LKLDERLARIRAILFDIDGTLANTDDDYIDRIASFMKPFHLINSGRTSREWARWLVTHTETPANLMKTVMDRLYIDELIGAVSDRLHLITGSSPVNRLTMIEGIHAMLEELRREYRLAIVTAREQRSSMAFLDQFALLPYFEVIVTARTTLRSKPHPAPIEYAAKQLGVQVGQCVMVGDTTVDMRSASSAGALGVGVLCGFGQREELLAAGADIIIGETRELTDLLL